MTALLLDHLWQSTLFAAAAGLLTLAFTANSAAVRYWLWFAASVKLLIPFSALTALGTYLFQSIAPKAPPPIFFDLQPAAEPFSGAMPVLTSPIAQRIDLTPLLLGLWALGFAVTMAIWFRSWLKLRSALAGASPLSIDAPMPVKSSTASLEPALIGIWRPVLLLPRGIETQLSPPEMRAILAHEHCHLRRRDNLLGAFHLVVETLFWFHPLVWWLGKRLIAERENACDEAVLAAGSDPKIYAESILKICRIYMQSPLACAAGVSGADLKKRMRAIMAERISTPLSVTKKLSLVVNAAAVIAAPVFLGLLAAPNALAQEDAFGPHPGTEAALSEQIEGWEKRRPVTEHLTQTMKDLVHQQQATVQMLIDRLGPLKSVVFKGRELGLDVYLTTFNHGALAWTVAPLVNGKISSMGFSPAVVRSDSGPSPGTEEALRRIIAGFSAGAPAYQIMTPGLIDATRQQLKALEEMAKGLGPLKTLTFKKISPRGWDVYHAVYENGEVDWTIQPLTDGRVDLMIHAIAFLNNAKPHPDREASLRRYIESLERGAPRYDDMAPPLAAIVRRQLPEVLESIKSLGQLKSVSFVGCAAGGSDVYLVTFERGKVRWTIGALAADGKAQKFNSQLL